MAKMIAPVIANVVGMGVVDEPSRTARRERTKKSVSK